MRILGYRGVRGEQLIPDELKGIPRWVVWRLEERDGKTTKVLYNPRDPQRRASSTDPGTWSDYQKAEAAATLPGVSGIGFVFNGDGLIGVDFDHVRDPGTGVIEPAALEEIRILNSYAEISPSGSGVHVIVKGKIPGDKRRKGPREIYETGRYFTVTGKHLEGTPETINESQAGIDTLCAKWFKEEERPPQKARGGVPAGVSLSDEEIVTRMKKARNYADIARLVNGDISGYSSASEADAALCAHLAFYTKDPYQIDRIFRQSGLYRAKWDDKHGSTTYGDTTIRNAIALVTDSYKPRQSAVTAPPGSIAERCMAIHSIKDPKTKEVIKKWVTIDNQKFVTCMEEKYHCISIAGNVWIYENGYYRPDKGEIQAELFKVTRELDLQVQTDSQKEIRAMLAGLNFYRDSPFNYKMGLIPARNGVIRIDMNTGEISGPFAHSPENLFTYCLKADFDPNAPTGPVIDLLKQWVADRDVGILTQFPAQGFIQSMIDASYKKSYLFQGETNSGKSSYFELLYRTIGDDDGTISHISIQAMCERPFSLYEMENRILNIYDDLDGSELTNHGRFKNITGNTHHPIEKKHSSGYNGRIFCAHGFSCNTPPKVSDKIKFDPAFWDRWEYVVFPNEYPKDPKFYENRYTPEILSGFLNLIVRAIADIYANNGLIQNSTYDQVMEKWLQDSEPLLQFIDEQTSESDRLNNFDKEELFNAYVEWFDGQDFPPRKKIATLEKFTRDIQSYGFLNTQCSVKRPGKKPARVRCYAASRVWNAGHAQMEPKADRVLP